MKMKDVSQQLVFFLHNDLRDIYFVSSLPPELVSSPEKERERERLDGIGSCDYVG